MSKLLSIDPGKTTGYAIFDPRKKKLLEADELDWSNFIHDFLPGWLTLSDDRVVIEKYRIRRGTVSANLGKDLRTVKEIGVIEWLCEERGIEYNLQPAGIGKEFFNRKRLEENDCWIVGKQHARDAIRHGLYFMTFGGSNNESL